MYNMKNQYKSARFLSLIVLVFFQLTGMSQEFQKIKTLKRPGVPSIYTGSLGSSVDVQKNIAVVGSPKGGEVMAIDLENPSLLTMI